MYVHNNKFIYIKKTVHWSSTLRIVYIVIFSFSILLLTSIFFLCVILHTILVVWSPRAPKHYSFLLHFSHKKISSNVCCLVTKQYRMHEQKNIDINRESACVCVYAYAIISLSLKKIDDSGTSWTWFFFVLSTLVSHSILCLIPNYMLYLCNEKLKNKLIQHFSDCICVSLCVYSASNARHSRGFNEP